ncbi:hypothetical protein J6590_093355 [Homalodisca vitripennis]|nr:hypothetical protein J6590_093355 [Homalodisca vitripennis]
MSVWPKSVMMTRKTLLHILQAMGVVVKSRCCCRKWGCQYWRDSFRHVNNDNGKSHNLALRHNALLDLILCVIVIHRLTASESKTNQQSGGAYKCVTIAPGRQSREPPTSHRGLHKSGHSCFINVGFTTIATY